MDRVLTLDLRKYIDTHLFGDRPHVRGRFLTVAEVARNALEKGSDVARLSSWLGITQPEALAALLYYAEHKDEIDA